MKVGDRVRVIAAWSSFRGREGNVKQTDPFPMVLLDGESKELRVGESEVLVIEQGPQHVAGAE